MNNERIDVLAVMERDANHASGARCGETDMHHEWQRQSREARAAVAELIEAARRVQMIPSPVGTGYRDGTPEDRAYIQGFMYALRLVREPGFACSIDAALARVRGVIA